MTVAQNNKLFSARREALVKAGLAPDKKLDQYTVDECRALIDAMEKNFADVETEITEK